MIKVRIKKEKHIKFSIPVPYTLLNIGCSLLTSEFIWKQIAKRASHNKQKQSLTPALMPLYSSSSKEGLKELVREIRRYQGIVLVDLRLKDGTEVMVVL